MLLFLFSILTWWEYNDDEFDKMKTNSMNKPILVVCYSKYCPHCNGLPEGTKQYADGIGNRTDIYVTMIECSENPGCYRFQITGTPHIALVIGKNRRYWPRIRSKNGEDWNKIIDSYLNPTLREIKTDQELIEAINEPTDGGATFHLETPDTKNQIFQSIQNLSNRYRLYNDTFTYRINTQLESQSPQLTVYTSSSCSIQYQPNSGTVEEFVHTHRFGPKHRYDLDEYSKTFRKTPLITIYAEENLNGAQKYALKSFSNDFCNKAKFGWISLKESKNMMKNVNKNNSELPLLVYHYKKCVSIYKGRVIKAGESGFLGASIDNHICGATMENGQVIKKNITQESNSNASLKEPIPERLKISGFKFSMIYLFSLLFLILVIRLRSTDENKEE